MQEMFRVALLRPEDKLKAYVLFARWTSSNLAALEHTRLSVQVLERQN
jgi:hypothetical protein